MATHHDLIIIGTGSGNSLVTPELEGLDIAIVEEGKFGGTCLNVGCIPTKMLVLPADRVIESREAERLGVTFSRDVSVDWPAIRDRIFTDRIDQIAAGGERYRRSQGNVTVYAATARFVGERRLALSTGEEITADRVVVAAGSRADLLDLDGLDRVDPDRGVHTSDTVMRMDELPRRMAIVGGGFVACEFAHVFSALGVEVTQIQRSGALLRAEDAEISRRYTELARGRHDVRLETVVSSATRSDAGTWTLGLKGLDGDTDVEVDAVLIAVGRTPNGARLEVEAGGIDVDARGVVVVDAQQHTSAEGVWALGDVANSWQLKHVANHEARVVAHNLAVDAGRLAGEPIEADHRFVPHAVFGHPQIAAFGPTRAELDEAGTPYVSKTQSFGDTAYGWALEDTTGILTVYADPTTGLIHSAHCLGPNASTLIQPLIQAASFGQNAHEVARGQYWIHPALAEVVENALLGLELEPEN
ncbi:dihydrolipoamide dehydrogenase [Janibacter sp. HTCC2649]|uniref:mycothione reductase n=1 Tax=Janibacter sp. HTCC2649 TaxID=313589 RepID=UPI0000670D0A|nr:mycothione reductase [Janibacter sp. HTCC2649]EAQ00321.1 dihydrolipoamide dehydrogenase [Janibacter sp. HTCC2649]